MPILLALLVLIVGVARVSAEELIPMTRPGGPFTAAPGSELVRYRKERPLPNIIGTADIFGRKVDTGLFGYGYAGVAPNGEILLRRVEIDIHSTASTASRSGGMIIGNSYYNAYGGTIYGNSIATYYPPASETNTVLPPRVHDFSVPVGTKYPLPGGYVLELQALRGDRLVYLLKQTGQSAGSETPAKGKRRDSDWTRKVFEN